MKNTFFQNEPLFRGGITAPSNIDEQALWFVFRDRNILIRSDPVCVPTGVDVVHIIGQALDSSLYIGRIGDRHCFTAALPDNFATTPGLELVSLREVYGRMDEELFWAAGRAAQLLDWDREHRFCGRCGGPTVRRLNERARECASCNILFFPRLAPAVIVLVTRGDEILMVRTNRQPKGVFSLVAGFVEPGESLEQAAVREVREETGVKISNLSYFASQPWPFLHSLMVGFMAEYQDGRITADPWEILEAGWYRWDRMPAIPGPLSLSRHLIEAYLVKHGGCS